MTNGQHVQPTELIHAIAKAQAKAAAAATKRVIMSPVKGVTEGTFIVAARLTVLESLMFGLIAKLRAQGDERADLGIAQLETARDFWLGVAAEIEGG